MLEVFGVEQQNSAGVFLQALVVLEVLFSMLQLSASWDAVSDSPLLLSHLFKWSALWGCSGNSFLAPTKLWQRGIMKSPQPHGPWSAHQVCCLEDLLQQGARSTDRCRLRNRAVFSPLIDTGLYFAAGDLANSICCVTAAICRYASFSLGNSLSEYGNGDAFGRKAFPLLPPCSLLFYLPSVHSFHLPSLSAFSIRLHHSQWHSSSPLRKPTCWCDGAAV